MTGLKAANRRLRVGLIITLFDPPLMKGLWDASGVGGTEPALRIILQEEAEFRVSQFERVAKQRFDDLGDPALGAADYPEHLAECPFAAHRFLQAQRKF